MAIVLNGITVPLPGNGEDIKAEAAKRLGISPREISALRVKRQSLDCRRKEIRLVFTLHVALYDAGLQRGLEEKYGAAQDYREPEIIYGAREAVRPVIVGAGPCGLFAALTLLRHGYKPLLLERGASMAEREKDVESLRAGGVLNPESNVCFGAGGAGAFSDGKLTTRIKDPCAEHVLETLAGFGAPEEILYMARPHAGTENIRAAVSRMIKKIGEDGGEVVFGARLDGIDVSQGELRGINYTIKGVAVKIETRAMILAVGHSARDTYAMLLKNGVRAVPKAFAVGLRIEHLREFVDRAQYKEAFSHPALGAAEYRLTAKSANRGVYTFCMCPGGEVICSSTEEGGIALNGMSYYSRSGRNSNSAVVVSVGPEDFPGGALGGVEFQREIERAAYSTGFAAPVQTVGDFLRGVKSARFGEVEPTYRPATVFMDLNRCLPGFVSGALKSGLTDFGAKIKGFDMPGALLTGVETRTSAPVRLLRADNYQAEGIRGIYPAGEGAGYAGGIVSSAVDGIRCAQALMREYKRR